jgi:hypothetical protein
MLLNPIIQLRIIHNSIILSNKNGNLRLALWVKILEDSTQFLAAVQNPGVLSTTFTLTIRRIPLKELFGYTPEKW